jgi:hypothetical protein
VPSSRSTPAQVIVADCEFGENYVSAATVTFKYFVLKENAERIPGLPLYYFEWSETKKANTPTAM